MWIFGLYPIEIPHQPVVSFWMIKYCTKIILVLLLRGKQDGKTRENMHIGRLCCRLRWRHPGPSLHSLPCCGALLKSWWEDRQRKNAFPVQSQGGRRCFAATFLGCSPSVVGTGAEPFLGTWLIPSSVFSTCCLSRPAPAHGSGSRQAGVSRLQNTRWNSSVALRKGWLEEKHLRVLACQTLGWKWEG